VFAGLVLPACQPDADVLATQFDQSCATVNDCVRVEELTHSGSMCVYHCPDAAINVKAKAAFDAAKSAGTAHCTSSAMPGCAAGGPLACVGGRCSTAQDNPDSTNAD
jgi:hypothetical protein